MDDQLYQELQKAKEEHREPRCPECQEPLVIEEMRYRILVWRWEPDYRHYYKDVLDEGTERPCCLKCKTEFRLWIGGTVFLRDLGLEY